MNKRSVHVLLSTCMKASFAEAHRRQPWKKILLSVEYLYRLNINKLTYLMLFLLKWPYLTIMPFLSFLFAYNFVVNGMSF